MPKIGVLVALSLLASPVGAAAVDRFVNPNNTCSPAEVGGDPEYDTIQDAVNDSSPGDVIFVCPGTYQETVAIAVDNLSLLGLPPVILQAEPGPDRCIGVSSANVTIRRLEITGCEVGIHVLHTASGGFIANNILHDNFTALLLNGPDGIAQNNLLRNNNLGILATGDGGQVNNNTVRNNLGGIFFTGRGMTVFKNLVQHNPESGIAASLALSCVVSFNSVSFNGGHGIGIFRSDGCTIQRNNAARNNPVDCFWDGFGVHNFVDNNCKTEDPPGTWD